MEIHLIYITASSKEEARHIAKNLLEEKLIACANIIDGVNSLYRWNGKLQDDSETIIIAKSPQARIAEIITRVKELHSYECPCIVSFPISAGNPAFLEWVDLETK